MRVEQKFYAGQAAAAPRTAPSRRFTLDDSDGAPKSSRAAAAAPLATLEALLAVQGEGDPAERRRRSVRRGRDLLDGLDRLKAALLGGRIAPGQLQDLASRMAERRESSGDPGLDDVLAQIELRAEVELAKLRRR